jgi:hypothetical protein
MEWTHIDAGDGELVYVPICRKPVWLHDTYLSRFPNIVGVLRVPDLRPWDIADLPRRLDHGNYARRVITGHDCFGVVCRALRLAGHPVSRWRGPVALFEYLNGLEGVHVQTQTR